MSPSRRSISWLLYLSSQDTQGGELRAFVQQNVPRGRVQCGSFEGDLQVGWLASDTPERTGTLPVYLATYPDVSNALYIVEEGMRKMITRRFDVHATTEDSGSNRRLMVPSDKFLNPSFQKGFFITEVFLLNTLVQY